MPMKYQIPPRETPEDWANIRNLVDQYLEGLITFSELVSWFARYENLREIRAADLRLSKEHPDLYVE